MKELTRYDIGGLKADAFAWLYDMGLKETMLIVDYDYVKNTTYDVDYYLFRLHYKGDR